MHTVYFFPGQGSDARIFSKVNLDSNYKKVFMTYPVPNKEESLKHYASRFISQIDTTEDYSFVGVSFGGMVSTELADVMNPKQVIILSSAKCKSELPFGYRFQKKVPVNKIIPAYLYSKGALVVQPLFEPDRNKDKATFVSMLKRKNPLYLKRAADMIINWEREEYPAGIVHIHGTKDNTLPIRNVAATYTLEGGSHMMTLTRAAEVNDVITHYLSLNS